MENDTQTGRAYQDRKYPGHAGMQHTLNIMGDLKRLRRNENYTTYGRKV